MFDIIFMYHQLIKLFHLKYINSSMGHFDPLYAFVQDFWFMHSRVKLYMTDSKQKRRHGNFSKMYSYISYPHKGYIYLLYLKYILSLSL